MKRDRIIDEDDITYKEVDYATYLKSCSKHKLVKSLESRYYVEID